MDTSSLLSHLYALSGLAACACYGPQLLRLARCADARRAMALSSWLGWLAASVVAVLYAVVVTRQPEMMAVSGVNALCQSVVVAMALAQRWADRNAKRAGPTRPGPFQVAAE